MSLKELNCSILLNFAAYYMSAINPVFMLLGNKFCVRFHEIVRYFKFQAVISKFTCKIIKI